MSRSSANISRRSFLGTATATAVVAVRRGLTPFGS